MRKEEILAIANNLDVPKFVFGTDALKEWTRQHRNPFTGQCYKDSNFYVVVHRSLNPRIRGFKILSRWRQGDVVPLSWDVPQGENDGR
ncbi:MAG: hypothetical protein PHV02_07145 [Rhodocyclaceae bacterium]|nr:hypothetical protein [Rhodocyclaceae bacterium]